MKSNGILNYAAVIITVVVIILSSAFCVFAATDDEYLVSAYDVTVSLNGDGSAEVVERVDFTFYGGFNNIMIPIAKSGDEEIEIEHVYMQRKGKLIECRQLKAGQWDADVFTGTYSLIDGSDSISVKIYGSFYRSACTVFLYYRVKNAVTRYGDVAEYRRMHIPRSWETRISSINIAIKLPEPVPAKDVKYWLHGVFIGNWSFTDSQVVRYDVPNTVPGEYVETRIVFPQSLVSECPVKSKALHLRRIMEEEREYQSSDKSDLLKAREAAARKAGQRALYERLKQRAGIVITVFSVLLILGALYFIVTTQKKLRRNGKMPAPSDFRGIDRFDPAEVRMLVSKEDTGARAMFGKLMELASRGCIGIGIRRNLEGRPRFVFEVANGTGNDELTDADRYLLDWIRDIASSSHEFDPIQLFGFTDSDEKAAMLKAFYDGWTGKVKEAYYRRNILDESITRYRNTGIIYSIVLLFLGFVIPVVFTAAAGYALLPVGLGLLVYSLELRKLTVYGEKQFVIWKSIRQAIKKGSVSAGRLPEWMGSCAALIGYGAALGAEKEAARWIAEHIGEVCGGCPLCSMMKHENLNGNELFRAVRNTVGMMDEAISTAGYACTALHNAATNYM